MFTCGAARLPPGTCSSGPRSQSKKSGGFGDTVLETKLVEDMADNLCKFAGATGAGLDEHLVRVHQAIQQDERDHLGKGKPEAAAGGAEAARRRITARSGPLPARRQR